jgi:MFS family permease
MNSKPMIPGVLIFFLMLPVTAVVPVLYDLTGGRHEGLGIFGQHLFMTANMVGAILSAPLGAYLGDRTGKRRIWIVGALFIDSLGFLIMTSAMPYAGILLVRFVGGAAHMTALSLLMAEAADAGGEERRGAAMGWIGLCLTLGVAMGAPLGGLLGKSNPENVLRVGAGILCVAATACLVFLPASVCASMPKMRTSQLPWNLQGIRKVIVPCVFTFVDRLTVGFLISTVTLYFRTILEADAARIGLWMGAFMLPFALLTYPAGRMSRRWNPLAMMIGGSLLYGIWFAALTLASVAAMPIMMTLGGVAAAMMFGPSLVLAAEATSAKNRSAAMAAFNASGSLGFLLGPLCGGAILAVFSDVPEKGFRIAILAAGAMEILCGLFFLWKFLVSRNDGYPPHRRFFHARY